jgi:hypothetical protein
MKRSRFTEEQIIGFLTEHKGGVSVATLYPPGEKKHQFAVL